MGDRKSSRYQSRYRIVHFLKKEKNLLLHMPNLQKITHCYTVQYLISAAGNVLGPAFVCLRELSGKFGSTISESLYGFRI